MLENKITGFSKYYDGPGDNSIVFRSRLTVKNEKVPFALLLDNSVYTLLQIQVGIKPLVIEGHRKDAALYLNALNTQYPMLSFTMDQAGNVLMSMVIPSVTTHFDAKLLMDIVMELQSLLIRHMDSWINNLAK